MIENYAEAVRLKKLEHYCHKVSSRELYSMEMLSGMDGDQHVVPRLSSSSGSQAGQQQLKLAANLNDNNEQLEVKQSLSRQFNGWEQFICTVQSLRL
jgi:hypothetical protein